MGSSGSGSFSDYPGNLPSIAEGLNGGSSSIDLCGVSFDCSLEEVSRCSFFMENDFLPPVGSEIIIQFNGSRLAAVDILTRKEIGYLPTKNNYIKTCIDNGHSYSGMVRTIMPRPLPTVLIDAVPI